MISEPGAEAWVTSSLGEMPATDWEVAWHALGPIDV